MLSEEQGRKLLKLARLAIYSYINKKKIRSDDKLIAEFSKPSGVFVTLEKGTMLRGCIGFIEAIKPLHQAVIDAAIGAAASDPRFPHLTKDELDRVTISISVLTKPTAIEVRNPEDYLKHITIGKDGLIVKGIFNSGLLLPIVAVEQGWDQITFIRHTCLKAGLPHDTWQDFNSCRIYKFQTEVFAEKSPNGPIYRKM